MTNDKSVEEKMQSIDPSVIEAARKSLENPGKSLAPLPKAPEDSNKPILYVFRHGETVDNLNRIFSGWRDAQLSDNGVKQAEELAEKLRDKRIDLGIHSHLSRSKDTLSIVLKHHPEAKVEEDDRIIERNYGDLAGKSKTELMEADPDKAILYRRGYDFPPPNGESIEMVEERVFPFCDELVKRMLEENINVALAVHSNSMRVIRRYFEKMSIDEMLGHENPLGQDYTSYEIE